MTIARAWVAEALGCDAASLPPNSGLNKHPKWDSFGHLKILLLLEERLGIEINDESIASLVSLAAIEDLVSKCGGERG